LKWIIITHYGLSKRDVASRRIIYLCNSLVSEGEEVTLVTWGSNYNPEELYLTDNRVKIKLVYYKRIRLASLVQRRAIKTASNSISSLNINDSERNPGIIKKVKFILRTLFADPYNTIFEHLLNKEFLKISERQYFNIVKREEIGALRSSIKTIVFTSASPAVMHRIGARIKESYPNVFWVADYRDQLIRNPVGQETPRTRRADFLAIRNADMLTTVSKGLMQEIANNPAFDQEYVFSKAYTLYNGFLRKPCEKANDSRTPTRRIRIVYTGLLYPMRRIDYLIKALSMVNSMTKRGYELVYCGSSGSIVDRLTIDENAKSFVTNKGFVSKEEVEIAQNDADILLLLKSNVPETGGMTGKFFEYLEKDKPILVLGDSDPEFNDIANKIGGIFVLPYDENRIRIFLLDFANKGHFAIRRSDEEVRNFDWHNLVKSLIDEVKSRMKEV